MSRTLSAKMECTEPVLIPTSSAISRTVTRRSFITKVRIWSMSSSFRLEGLPERASLSTDVQASLNRFYHYLWGPWHRRRKSAESSEWFPLGYHQASDKIWCNTAARVLPSFSQKITTRRALRIHSPSHAGSTRLTLSAGRKKSRYAHENPPLYHSTHTHASLVSAGKNHVGCFLNSPRMNIKISYRCSLFPSWSGEGLTGTLLFLSVSLRMELGSHWTDFREFYIWIFLKNLLRKFLSKNTDCQAIW